MAQPNVPCARQMLVVVFQDLDAFDGQARGVDDQDGERERDSMSIYF